MWIKICGITTAEDALTVADAGASAIGLNFYQASPRCVTRAQARLITDRVSEDIDVVGLFVSDPAHRAAQIVDEVGLTAVQFHGDQSPSEVQRFQRLCPHTPVIRGCVIVVIGYMMFHIGVMYGIPSTIVISGCTFSELELLL